MDKLEKIIIAAVYLIGLGALLYGGFKLALFLFRH